MDELLRTNPREFQKISARVISIINPYKEEILDTRELTRKILEQAERSRRDKRILNFLKGGPKLIFKAAEEGETWAQRILGWIKPWEKRVVKAKPAVKWRLKPLVVKKMIETYEMAIVKARHALRELGYPLKPYSAARIRRLEEEYMRQVGWIQEGQEKKKRYWWDKRG